jgi:hypothetical protein
MVFKPIDTVKADEIIRKAISTAESVANELRGKGVNVIVHELVPTHLGLTDNKLVLTGTQFSKKIDDNCALVIYGFFVNDTAVKHVKISNGTKELTYKNIAFINNFTEKVGFDDGFESWGVFKEASNPTFDFYGVTANSTVTVFPIGFAIMPEGTADIVV